LKPGADRPAHRSTKGFRPSLSLTHVHTYTHTHIHTHGVRGRTDRRGGLVFEAGRQ